MATALKTDLEGIWIVPGQKPAKDDKVKEILETRIADVKSAAHGVAKVSDNARGKEALDLLDQHEALLKITKHERELARAVLTGSPSKADCDRLADQLAIFADDLRSWRGLITGLVMGDIPWNTRARFADAGAWAIHFSMVRMTVTIFLVTAAWGVVSVKWNEYSPELCRAAWAAWGLAATFLILFTLGTYDKSRTQKKCQFEMPTASHRDEESSLTWAHWRWIWSPVFVYAAATIGFWFLTDAWKKAGSETPVTWTAIADKSSIKPKEDRSTAKSMDFAQWERTLNAMAASLAKIDVKLDQINNSIKTAPPTITPTSTVPPKAPRTRHSNRKD